MMSKGIYKRTKPAWNKGLPCSEKQKKQISLANKGKHPIHEFKKGDKLFLGKKHTIESRKKMSLSHIGKSHSVSEEARRKIGLANSISLKGKKQSKESRKKKSDKLKGSNNPNWKGGITSKNRKVRESLEYRLWREVVFKRDNYTCIWCGVRNGNGKTIKIQADHIKSFINYPELRFAIDNGRKDGEIIGERRSSPSQEWNKGRQQDREFSSDEINTTQSYNKNGEKSNTNNMSSLPQENKSIFSCPYCGSNKITSGVVLDCFFGAGTTGLVALKQNKKFIGIELNPKYIEIANRRLKPYLSQQKLPISNS